MRPKLTNYCNQYCKYKSVLCFINYVFGVCTLMPDCCGVLNLHAKLTIKKMSRNLNLNCVSVTQPLTDHNFETVNSVGQRAFSWLHNPSLNHFTLCSEICPRAYGSSDNPVLTKCQFTSWPDGRRLWARQVHVTRLCICWPTVYLENVCMYSVPCNLLWG